jgi:phosphoribosyl-ATP pyrophosphohydrolase/phosphoribosyl-AMP cyclohydrolase/histidinol dehydrogenase
VVSWDKKGWDALIPDYLLTSKPGNDKQDVGSLLRSFLVTDRSDGLFSTVVVDEQGVALGFCFSSTESIQESLKTGEGVYFSRKRGLWHKGATSGATQKLVSIDVDCDRDVLRFMVHQKEPGKAISNDNTILPDLDV